MRNPTTTSDEHPWMQPRTGWLGRLAAFLTAYGAGEDEGDEGGDGGDAGGDADDDDDGDNLFGMDPDEVDEDDAGTGGVQDDDDDAGEGDDDADDDDGDDDDDDDEGEGDEEDEDEENDEDDDEDDDDDQDDDEVVELLTERWDAKLERMQAAGEHAGPAGARVALGAVRLTDDGFKRFKAAMEKAEDDEDGRATAEAMFEVAMDAVVASLGEYHANAVSPEVEKAQVSAASLDMDRRLERFLDTPQGEDMEASPKIKKKMGELFEERKKKHGWRIAMQIPYKDYYRMAGGKAKGKGSKGGKAAKRAAAKKRSSKKKDEALAAARQPRGRRSTAPRKGGKKVSNAQRESADYIRRTSKPFFSVN